MMVLATKTLLLIVATFSHVFLQVQGWNMAMVTGTDSQFDAIKKGWNDECAKLAIFNVTCETYSDLQPQLDVLNLTKAPEDGAPCVTLIRWFVRRGDVDAMVIRCPDSNVYPAFEDAKAAGIPVAVMEAEWAHRELGPFDTFIGSDPQHVGRTMARTLRQLRPEGGTYVAFYNDGSTHERFVGFKDEIEKDNNRDDRSHWVEAAVNYSHLGLGWQYEGEDLRCDGELKGWGPFGYRDATSHVDPGNPFVQGIKPALEHAADVGADAIVFLYGYPMTNENYTVVVDNYRDKNISWLGVDGTVDNLNYMAQNYVDALVGEQTYQIGLLSAQTLYKMLTDGVDSVPKRVATKLINYNLVPEELPPLKVDQNLLGDLHYVGFVCFGIVAFGCAFCIFWTIWYREAVVVKASQPFFLAMTATGVLVMASMLIPLSFDDNGQELSEEYAIGICMSIPWLGFTGFSITFSAMFAKTWRVNQFFKSSNAQARIRVRERDVMIPFLLTFALNTIVLICWTLIDPLKYVRTFEDGTDLWNREIASSGGCQSKNSIPYLVPLGLINLVVLVVACWQAYEARDIKSEFAEAKYIAMTVFSLTQGFLTGLPIVVVARENPETFYLILTVLVFGISMVVLSLIFIPKVRMQRRYGKMSVNEQKKKMLVSVRLSAGMEGEWSGKDHKMSSGSVNKLPGSQPMNQPMAPLDEGVPVRISDLRNDAPSSDTHLKSSQANTDGSGNNSGSAALMVAKDFSGRHVMSSYLEPDEDVQSA